MSHWRSDTTTVYESGDCNRIPTLHHAKPPQVPNDPRPTIFTARKHRNTDEVVELVNAFFLKNWPFKNKKQEQRFIDEGYAWFVCINCPMSLDERMHWGCQLLATGFLIDDLLDRMSIEEGKEHQENVIKCASGIILPDRKIPAQWIMFDLFEEMRATDRPLADELLKPTVDFLRAQVDGNRMKRMNLDEYFAYRDADLGKGMLSGIMRFCAGLSITPEELELAKEVEENCMKHITFVNDICSYDKEVMTASEGSELGAMCSSIPIIKADHRVDDDQEAKSIMWEMVRDWELRHFELVEKISSKNISPALAKYLKGVEYQAAGNEHWSLLTPRYNKTGSLAFNEGR
ncbi:Aristolochene synthase [Pyrenophora tritici-repentis]|nr:Aristolochene synthase [Pyrenophora tritici-repentis]